MEINIDNLTVGQLKEIQAMSLGVATTHPQPAETALYDRFVGKPVLIRHNLHGVNCGVLANPHRDGFYLDGGRKFWRWQAENGVSLESFSSSPRVVGTRASHIKESVCIPTNGLCGIILLSQEVFEFMLSLETSHQD